MLKARARKYVWSLILERSRANETTRWAASQVAIDEVALFHSAAAAAQGSELKGGLPRQHEPRSCGHLTGRDLVSSVGRTATIS
jgi:hypothetical protein